MLETKQALQTERAAWLHEAEVERNQVEHQMMDTFKRYAAQQSAQFEQTAQAERQYLTSAAKSEVESSRQELVLAQARFQDTSSQQSVQISTLRGVLANSEAHNGAVREDLQRLRAQSENYSQLLERAEHNWQRMQTETLTANQLVRTQRSELNSALSELSVNRSATGELRGQFATLEQAQANSTAECRWLTTELRSERHPVPVLDGTA